MIIKEYVGSLDNDELIKTTKSRKNKKAVSKDESSKTGQNSKKEKN